MKTSAVKENGHRTGGVAAATVKSVQKAEGGAKPELICLYDVPKLVRLEVPIRGRSPFLSHRKDDKAGRLWEDKMKGQSAKRVPVDPEEEWKASRYIHPESGRSCIPGRGIKKAMVATHIFGNDKTLKRRLQGAFFVTEEFIPIDYEKEVKRRDFLPLMGGRGHHNSYRMEFFGWKAKIPIEFDATLITAEALVNMLERAGTSIGIGDDRPEKSGMHGRFSVVVPGRA